MFAVTTALFAAFAASVAQSALLDVNSFGLDYSPYRDGQSPSIGAPKPTQEQIEEDFSIMANITNEIRLYDMGSETGMTEKIVLAAKNHNFKVHLQAWIGKNLTANDIEIGLLIDSVNHHSETIVSLIIGSETLHRKDVTEKQLLSYIQQVKDGTKENKKPISCANIHWPYKLTKEVDYIMLHKYPFWEGKPIDYAADSLLSATRDMKNRYKKTIKIGETGWTSAYGFGNAIGSDQNQLKYIKDMHEKTSKYNLNSPDFKIFLFSAFDEKWKTNEGGQLGTVWGLFNADRSPKLAVKSLWYGEKSDECTGEGDDPKATNFPCCPEFRAKVGNWNNDGRWYYRCIKK
eukprot:Pgem_evm1s16100